MQNNCTHYKFNLLLGFASITLNDVSCRNAILSKKYIAYSI